MRNKEGQKCSGTGKPYDRSVAGQENSMTEVQWTETQRDRSATGQKCSRTEVQQDRNAAGQKYSGTEMQQDRKTEGQKGAEL